MDTIRQVVFFFLRLIEEFYLYDTLQVVQPVACCSVQHHQVSVTTVLWTFAGDVLCGLVVLIRGECPGSTLLPLIGNWLVS